MIKEIQCKYRIDVNTGTLGIGHCITNYSTTGRATPKHYVIQSVVQPGHSAFCDVLLTTTYAHVCWCLLESLIGTWVLMIVVVVHVDASITPAATNCLKRRIVRTVNLDSLVLLYKVTSHKFRKSQEFIECVRLAFEINCINLSPLRFVVLHRLNV